MLGYVISAVSRRVTPRLPAQVKRVCVAALAWLALGVAACTPPDRSAEVRHLQAEITKMPGVDDVKPLYTNDFENGAQLNMEVSMPKASEEQIASAASRITRIKGGDFNGYRQSTTFVVGDRLEVTRGGADLNPAQIAADTHRLRQLRTRVPQASILWSRDGATVRLEVSAIDHTSDVLSAVLATVQPEPMTVYVRSAEPTKFPTWEVGVPITAEQRANIDALISRLALPIYYVRVDDARITELSVYITAPATAYRDLKSVISTVAPTKQHPLQLQWHLMVEPDNFHQFTGDLQVPDCRDRNGSPKPQAPQGNQTSEAAQLQQQLESDFNDCR